MLENSEKAKIEKHIDEINTKIMEETQKFVANKMSNKQVIERTIQITVNKFTPESKMIMSSAYNMMMKHTLEKPMFKAANNKAAFYQMNILSELNSKFIFDVPNHIDYEENEKEISKGIAVGAIVVLTGGGISFRMEMITPIAMAVIIAGAIIGYKMAEIRKAQDVMPFVVEYLRNVAVTIMQWLDGIEKYYDARVEDLERGLE